MISFLESLPIYSLMPGVLQRMQKIKEKQDLLQIAREEISAFISWGNKNARELWSFYKPDLYELRRQLIAYLYEKPVQVWGGWDAPAWHAWYPTHAVIEKFIRVGVGIEPVTEDSRYVEELCEFPILLPFIGGERTIIIHSQGDDNRGIELLQSLVVRTTILLPQQARYTLIDPAGAGRAFPMRRSLLSLRENSVRENSGDLYRDLQKVKLDIQRIMETYIDTEVTSFEQLPDDIRANESFEFIFAADFPNGYDRRDIEYLYQIANAGPAAGKYVFLHYNEAYEVPRDMELSLIKNAIHIHPDAFVPLPRLSNLKLKYDSAPSAAFQNEVFGKLSQVRPPEREITWNETVAPKTWWGESSTMLIETAIGIEGSRGSLKIWFGANSDGRPCAHGMLAGMPGSGKSNLYHVLILGLTTRYSPDELRLYLIDGKDGVEFQPYRHLPHLEVISLRSSPELSRSILAELLDEKERRNAIFSSAGVRDLPEYRKAGQPQGNLARVLLLIDEYQELFEDDRDNVASQQLLLLAQQGRSAGIHMLLGSQRFGAVNMLNQNSIFGNIHLRIAMKMAIADVQGLTEFDRRGKQLILNCDLPGKAVLNDNSGDDNSNIAGKVAYLASEQREEIIRKLIDKAHHELKPDQIPYSIVFDGKEQPKLIENPILTHLLDLTSWLSSSELESWVRRERNQGGLGISEWYSSEHPNLVLLGQEYNVRGQAMILMRRSQNENLLLIGGNNPARYGMIAASLVSLAATKPPQEINLIVVDRSLGGSEWSNTLSQVIDYVLRPASFSSQYTKDAKAASNIILDTRQELDRRLELSRNSDNALLSLPSLFVVMTDIDRLTEIIRVDDGYGATDSELGKELRRLYTEGPAVGIHVILSFSSFGAMKTVLDERRGLNRFRHRIAMQMSDDESFSFVRSREAARLQKDGPVPVSALYLDDASNRSVRFKPYTTEAKQNFAEQLQTIGKQLKERQL